MEGTRVILAGGSGLVGRRLASALLDRGARVAVLSRSPRGAAVPDGASVHGWEDLPGLLEGGAAVVNLAGEGIADRRWTPDRKRILLTSRTGATERIVDALKRVPTRPGVLVNASAIGFYGFRPGLQCDESTPAGEGFFPEVCTAWEAAAEGAAALGVRVVRLRIGVVLAREGGALPKMALPVRLFAGAALGGGAQAFSWIHLDDLVDLLLACLQDPRWVGAVNATAPNPVSQSEFMHQLGRRLHRPILPVPARLTRAAVRLLAGEMAGPMLLEGTAVLPRKALDLGFRFRHPGIAGALEDLLP